MRDFHLRFCQETRGWPTHEFDLMVDSAEREVTSSGGAYVLGTSDGTMLTYRWGNSPVYCIAKAENLHHRLMEHRRYIIAAKADHDDRYWWPTYQYGDWVRGRLRVLSLAAARRMSRTSRQSSSRASTTDSARSRWRMPPGPRRSEAAVRSFQVLLPALWLTRRRGPSSVRHR